MNYIDSHMHVWTDEEAYPMDPNVIQNGLEMRKFLPSQALAHANPSGVSRIVLVQMSYYGIDNSYLLDVIAEDPSTFRGIAVIDPLSPNLASQMRTLRAAGIRGFRLVITDESSAASMTGGAWNEMFECAAREGMAICLLINPEYLSLLPDVCASFPDTGIVIDHLARIGMSTPVREEEVRMLSALAKSPGVAVKISAFYALGSRRAPHLDLVELIHQVLDAYGAERLMWGSDCPFQIMEEPYESSLALIRDHLELPGADRDMILRGTAERLFFSPNE